MESIQDEYSEAVEIVRKFESLGPIARSMVVGGLKEIRGEDILVEGEKTIKSNTSKSGGKPPKEPVTPEKVSTEPSGKLEVTLKGFSSEYNDSYLAASLTITNSSPGSYWLSKSGNVNNEWIAYDFGKSVKVTKVAILASSSYDINPKNITVQIPKDSDWKDYCKLIMENGQTSSDQWQVFTIGSLTTSSIRLFFHDRHGSNGGSCILVSSVRFY